MIKSLYLQNEIKKIEDKQSEYISGIRNEFGNFINEQSEMYSGFSHLPFGRNPTKGYKIIIPNNGEIFSGSLLIPDGIAIVISPKFLKILGMLNLPKHEVWPIFSIYKGKQIEDYFLINFYYDYFQEIDFCLSELFLYERTSNLDYVKLKNQIEILNVESWLNWHRDKIANFASMRNYFLRFEKIVFKNNISTLDIVYSKSDTYLLISEKFQDILINNKIKNIEVFNPPIFHGFA